MRSAGSQSDRRQYLWQPPCPLTVVAFDLPSSASSNARRCTV